MSNSTTRRFSAFTLVELMIVIGVISILAAMTFPAVGFVRNRAQQNACLSNMRQWGMAFSGYLDEHRGKFPSPFGKDDKEVWYNVLSPYLGEPSMKELCDADKAPVAGQSGRTAYLCPVDRAGDLFEDEKTGSKQPYSSYAMNANIADSVSKSGGKRLRLPQLRHPSTFVVLAESGIGCEDGITRTKLHTAGPAGDAFRHSRSINLCFADGSAGRFAEEDIHPDSPDNVAAGHIIWSAEVDAEN